MLKNFVWHIIAEKGELSSKRLIAVVSLLVHVAMALYAAFTSTKIDPDIYDSNIMVMLGSGGISAAEKIADIITRYRSGKATPAPPQTEPA